MSASADDYIPSDYEKENYSEESNSGGQETELKRKLFENLKKAGILDGMKSTLRGRLYDQLKPK